jgi:hypothetical protein
MALLINFDDVAGLLDIDSAISAVEAVNFAQVNGQLLGRWEVDE